MLVCVSFLWFGCVGPSGKILDEELCWVVVHNLTLNHLNAAVLVTATRFFGELLDYCQSGPFVIVSLHFDIPTFLICARLNEIDAMARSVFGFDLWEFLYDG